MQQISEFIVNHWVLWAAFIVLLALTLINEWMSSKKKAKELSPQELIDLINNDQATVIDIREKDAFKKGHIINAVNAQVDDFSKPKMASYKDKQLVIVCHRGISAGTCALKIKEQGFNALVLNGGMGAWIDAELPLVKD